MPQHQGVLGDTPDPFVKYLNERGYQPIVVAKGGIFPPMICILDAKRKRYEFRYKLEDVLLPGARPLEVNEGAVVDMEKEKVAKQGGELSVGFMSKIAALFGAGNAKIDVAGDVNKGATFNFQNVISKFVLLGPCADVLTKYVDKNKVPDDDDMRAGNVHVAYDFLYAGSLERHYANDWNAKAGVEGGVPEALSFKLAGHVENKNGEAEKFDQAKHQNPQRVAFAFKVAQMKYTPGGVTLKGSDEPGEGFNQFEGKHPYYLFDPQAVIEFDV